MSGVYPKGGDVICRLCKKTESVGAYTRTHNGKFPNNDHIGHSHEYIVEYGYCKDCNHSWTEILVTDLCRKCGWKPEDDFTQSR